MRSEETTPCRPQMISALMLPGYHPQVVSKLKFEFELVCSVRSFRLRTPSAQAPPPLLTTYHSLATTTDC